VPFLALLELVRAAGPSTPSTHASIGRRPDGHDRQDFRADLPRAGWRLRKNDPRVARRYKSLLTVLCSTFPDMHSRPAGVPGGPGVRCVEQSQGAYAAEA
jgi:hypothetical protein